MMAFRKGYGGQEKNSLTFYTETERLAIPITVIAFFNGAALLPCHVLSQHLKVWHV